MNAPKFLINTILESCKDSPEELCKKLFEHKVLSKDYVDNGLLLLYNKFDSPVTTEICRECRSLVIDRSTLKIISYSCETPYLNMKGMKYLTENSNETQIINQCYEGTMLSVFNHNDKWYVSTRRCLDSQESIIHPEIEQKQMSHYEMFDDVLKKAGYIDFNDFSKKLDPSNSYYFVLIHHKNKHTIDYTNKFGNEYGRVCLTAIRDTEMRELDIYKDKVDFASYDDTSDDSSDSNIFVSKNLESFETLTNYNEPIESEGVVIRVWDEKMNKNHLIKLQHMNYQFSQAIGSDKNIFKGLIYLYQNNKLIEYFDKTSNNESVKKIVNPLNTSMSYDTVGTIDAMFKVCASELFVLFKNLWSLKTGKQQNTQLYEHLPKEYRDIMYLIRGIYYKKKFIDKDKESITPDDIKNTHLKLGDIYNCLKYLPTETFIAFIRMRKLMFNWVKTDSTNPALVEFGTISTHCEKIHIKLCAIFTNKLYPNIMPNDIPPQKELTIESG